jgi:hypothetical protein
MRLLTTVPNGPQAELICARLEESGIPATARGDSSVALSWEAAPHDIYVDDADLERARAALDAFQSVGDDELVEAEEEAAGAPDSPQPPE